MHRVLFIHGLESGPSGSKVRMLRGMGFEVHASDMHMSLKRLDKKNSVARSALRLVEVQAVGLGLLAALIGGIALSDWRLSAAGLVGGLLIIGLRRRRWLARAMADSRAACVAVQRDAVSAFQPTVVVGSSWGGAVACSLMVDGAWTGPTVLLAPAMGLVQDRIDPAETPALMAALVEVADHTPLVMFHDPDDDVVPIQYSRELAGTSTATLHEAPGAGHRLLATLEDGRLEAALRTLCE